MAGFLANLEENGDVDSGSMKELAGLAGGNFLWPGMSMMRGAVKRQLQVLRRTSGGSLETDRMFSLGYSWEGGGFKRVPCCSVKS